MRIANFLNYLFSNLSLGQPDQEASATIDHVVAGGPLMNVDGIPMMNETIDVMGKLYGDSSSPYGDNFGMSDGSMQLATGSDW